MLSFIKNFRLLLVTISAVSIAAFSACSQLSMAQTSCRLLTTPQSRLLETGNTTIHFMQSGDCQKPAILFIHGSPGSWDAFESYLLNTELQKEFFMVSIDRPGWGKSNYRDKSTTDFTTQTNAIIQVMAEFPNKEWLLVGHSYGASLLPNVALKKPESIHALLLLAGSVDPALGKARWYNKFARLLLVKALLPTSLKKSNIEILKLQEELAKMDKNIAAVSLPIKMVIIQGMKDKLVSPQNIHYPDKHWKDSFQEIASLKIDNTGHFLPWRESTTVIKHIRKHAIKTQTETSATNRIQ